MRCVKEHIGIFSYERDFFYGSAGMDRHANEVLSVVYNTVRRRIIDQLRDELDDHS